MIQNETIIALLADLQLEGYTPSKNLIALEAGNSRYIKDLKINTGNALNNTQYLSKKEAALIALGVAVNEGFLPLQESFTQKAKVEGANDEEIAEAIASTSLMNINNVFYRFRHFMNKDSYNNTPAGIKMSIMMSPVLGKEFFELFCLAISSINGCEMCVRSHEQSVLQHGSTEGRVFEAVKSAAMIKGLISILA